MAVQIKQVTTITEVKALFESIEENGDEWFSNFLASDDELARWIEKGQVSIESTSTTALLLRQRYDCKRLYFANTKREDLVEDLHACLSNAPEKIITSVLDRNGENASIKEALHEAGFSHYSILKRLVKINEPTPPKKKSTEFAKISDLPRIMEMLRKYFDPLVDEWPDEDEVMAAIQHKQILVMRLPEDGKVIAFQSFERQGKTLYGRYLAAMEEHRKTAPSASILFLQCQRLHSDVRKVVGWIQEGNPVDVERMNRSMGLDYDGVTDEIFLR